MDGFEGYCHDLGRLLREIALDAKHSYATEKSEFAAGYMAGFHRVVSLMQQQCQAFGIPLEKIGLDGVDPDRDLV